MSFDQVPRLSHKEWRKQAKKQRRKRLRRMLAQKRDEDAEKLRETLEKSADYLKWLQEEEEKEENKRILEEQLHAEREQLWLEEEEKAQKEWQALKERKEKARETQRQQEELLKKEYEEKQKIIRQRQLDEKARLDQEMEKYRETLKQINDYIDTGARTPEGMRDFRETNPSKEVCPFFEKTSACRYGDSCSRNHRKIGLSKIILISHFYNHFSLEKQGHEYDTDNNLEFDSSETRQHVREFYKDVVPELENFGRIKTLLICCNTLFHLRGNVYVEFCSERDAARAVRNLNGRWYAGRQLTCEPANIPSCRQAVCGLRRNCPKGNRACNFLHTYTNPDDKYTVKNQAKYVKNFHGYTEKAENCSRSERRMKSGWGDTQNSKEKSNGSLRWSESPERKDSLGGWNDDDLGKKNCQNRRKQRQDSVISSSRSSRYSVTPERHKRSSSSRSSRHKCKKSRQYENYNDEEDSKGHKRSSSKSRRERRRRSREWKSRRSRSRNRDSEEEKSCRKKTLENEKVERNEKEKTDFSYDSTE